MRPDDWYEGGCHVAAFDATFGKAKPVFLQYRLPVVVLPPPIQVCNNTATMTLPYPNSNPEARVPAIPVARGRPAAAHPGARADDALF